MLTLKTIDAHAAGEPLRLIVDGFPSPRGKTMLDKREWLRRHADHLRRALMLEPRGHADMYGAILTEPVHPGSHAGVLFMHNEGYSTMCGHGIVAVTTIALERGLLMPGGDGTSVVYDSPAGIVRARANVSAGAADAPGAERRVASVAFVNVPSFVLHAGLTVKLAARTVRADVAFGGAFYATCPERVEPRELPRLIELGRALERELEAAHEVVHPLEPELRDVYGVIFWQHETSGPPLVQRNVTVFADGEVDRSPCGSGTSARLALLHAAGELQPGAALVHRSIVGTEFTARVVAETEVAGRSAVVTEVEGSAYRTGRHAFELDPDDRLGTGFLLR